MEKSASYDQNYGSGKYQRPKLNNYLNYIESRWQTSEELEVEYDHLNHRMSASDIKI